MFAKRLSEDALCATPDWKGVRVCTEFSGSGCAEAAVESAGVAMGFDKEHIEFQYSADIDKQCQQVLRKSCPGFSVVFLVAVTAFTQFLMNWLVGGVAPI